MDVIGHYYCVIMSAMASQITDVSVVFRRRSKKTPKVRVTRLCEGNPPVTGGFPLQKASNVENVSIWWRHHVWMNMYSCIVCKLVLITCHRLLCDQRNSYSWPLCCISDVMSGKMDSTNQPNQSHVALVPVRSLYDEISKPQDISLEMSDRSGIWQKEFGPRLCDMCDNPAGLIASRQRVTSELSTQVRIPVRLSVLGRYICKYRELKSTHKRQERYK